jgi:pyruvate dehydrogenase E1 component alpha subunit
MTSTPDAGQAARLPSAAPDQDLALALLFDMVRVRRMEEACAQLYGAGKIRGFLHLYIGEEAVAAGALRALCAEDNVAATYREHGHALLRGVPMRKIMAEMFGKQDGCCRGRGGSMHLFDREARFFGGNAIVGGGLPLTTGLALADHMQERARVNACFFGEGAMAEGAFHESMNLAALWRLPVLFLCENNFYAMGTAIAHEHARTDLCPRAASYGMPARSVDGMDVMAVYEAVKQVADQMRKDPGPAFIECQTYRYRAHSMFDPDLYRDKAEVEGWKERGPIHTFSARLKAAGLLTEQQFLELEERATAEIADAIAFADAALPEPVEDLLKDVQAAPGPPP